MSPKQVLVVDSRIDWDDDYAVERARWDPLGIKLILAQCQTEDEIIAAAGEADILVYQGLYTPFTARVMEALPRCQFIIRYGIGVDSVDIPAATGLGVIVGNAAEYCVPEVADHASALILALARHVVFHDRTVQAGGWRGGIQVAKEISRLSTLTLGLVGLGRIGRQVARKMAPFFGTIITHDPYISQKIASEYGARLVELPELMARSDCVSIHTPLLPSTHHLINASLLALMKPTAFIVNTSRGPVIDQAALVETLKSGQIAGAALDVAEVEPLPPDSPLRGLDNVILTPHIGANSLQAVQDLRASVAHSVAEVAQGYWPPYVLNPTVQPRFPLKKREGVGL
jgi:D-3-phosphoglycerate dehydrogenase